MEISSSSKFQDNYLLQKDDVHLDFQKYSQKTLKNIQHQNSQRTKSIFTNNVYSIIYSYLSIVEKAESH